MKRSTLFILGSILITMTACNNKEKSTLQSGINKSFLDETVSPAQDFYQYACGGWMKQYPLTGEYARYGSFDKLGEDNQKQLKDLITGIAAKKHDKETIPQKIGDLYNMGMDSATLEKQGATPVQAQLQSIADMKNIKELTNMLAELYLKGIGAFFSVFAEANPANSNMNIAWLWQTGLGIGDRDYYLEKETQPIRDQYVVLLTKMLQLSGYNKMSLSEGKEENMAKAVLALETEMAKVFMDKNDLRDPHKTYNYMSTEDLQKIIPAVDVKTYFKNIGLQTIDSLNVGQPDYVKGLNKILQSADLQTVKAYLALQVVNDAAPYLSNDFV